MNKKLIVFDLDGTLNRTELHSVPAQTQVLKEFNAPYASPERIISTFGAPYQEYTQILLPNFSNEEKIQYLKRVACVEADFLEKYAKPYDGIPELLEKIHSDNMLTAVCSNASTRYITSVLNALKINDKINYIQPLVEGCSKIETLGILLNKIKPKKAFMVGDTAYDMEAAIANNIEFIGCMYGFRPKEIELTKYKAYTANEIFDIIEKLM